MRKNLNELMLSSCNELLLSLVDNLGKIYEDFCLEKFVLLKELNEHINLLLKCRLIRSVHVKYVLRAYCTFFCIQFVQLIHVVVNIFTKKCVSTTYVMPSLLF